MALSLVTGVAGFIGSSLARRLLAQGDEVRGLDSLINGKLERLDDLRGRLTSLFLKGADGARPTNGTDARLQTDPHFQDCVWFHEYFHGDSGVGLGAAHQTGWTGLVANLLGRGRAR